MSTTLQRANQPSAQTKQTAFYTDLREQMLTALVRGGQLGDQVPSERQLAKQFNTSTMTVARVLQEFQTEGWLRRVPGKGTFICGTDSPQASAPTEALHNTPAQLPAPTTRGKLTGVPALVNGAVADAAVCTESRSNGCN